MPQPLEHGNEKSGGLSGAGASHGNDVVAGEDEGHGLPLNGSRDLVALALDSSVHIGAQA